MTGGVITKYYYARSQRIAMRENNELMFIISDHLGSSSLVTDSSGTVINQTKYKAWGETRYTSGSEQTKYGYTGQYSYVSDFGLHFYNARWYDSYLNHFTQPDSIVPDPYNPQDWDRYAYARNNPLRYTDPTGHVPCPPGVRCPATAAMSSSNVIFFGGSYPTDINIAGPSPYNQARIWTKDQSGRRVHVVPYPGNQYLDGGNVETSGKTQQSIDAQGLLPDENVNLIAYSAGTESALMYAVWRLENGQDVNSIVLLGPTFETSSMNFDEPDGGWSAVMDSLIEQGVNIYILDDENTTIFDRNDAYGYSPPTGSGYGNYVYKESKWKHYSTHPEVFRGAWQGTNNKPSLKKDIYSWLME